MSKFDDAVHVYLTEMKSIGLTEVDETLLRKITKSLGPSIYLADAAKVSCSDKEERERLKKNFLVGKLKLKNDPSLDVAIDGVCQEMGASNRNKYRAVFHYLLVRKLGKENVFLKK